jgi:hypothetical protein
LAKIEKIFSNSSPPTLPFIPSLEKELPWAHICVLLSMVHPSVSEEVEEHKHIFFLKVPDASFQEVEGHKHNFVSLSRLLM